MKNLIRWLCVTVVVTLISGCAHFTTKQTDSSYDPVGKPQRTITTKASATTFFDAKSALSKFRASQTDKSQSATVGDLNAEASSAGVVAIINAAASAAAKVPVVP